MELFEYFGNGVYGFETFYQLASSKVTHPHLTQCRSLKPQNRYTKYVFFLNYPFFAPADMMNRSTNILHVSISVMILYDMYIDINMIMLTLDS